MIGELSEEENRKAVAALHDSLKEQTDLTNKLDKASKAYYCGDDSDLTDTEFDLELKKLQKMEKESGIVLPNSPTQRVGSDVQKEFGKIKHPDDNPMYTIENVYSDEELLDWVNSKLKIMKTSERFAIEPKFDGISVEIHYWNGNFISASTRGDKKIGDDISPNAMTIHSIPLSIDLTEEEQEEFTDVYVRGEILLPKSELATINKQRIEEGEKPFSNTRNACAGSIKQLDPKVTAKRHLIFRPWDVFFYKNGQRKEIFGGHSEKMDWVGSKGFPDSEIKFTTFDMDRYIHADDGPKNMEEVLGGKPDLVESINSMHEHINDALDYDCDGVVIKIDSVATQNAIGTKDNRAIEWAIARKWNEEKEVITILEDVKFQVGRTGNITPVGILKPVSCDGVIISNVMLNNEKFISDNNLKINSPVRIVRSGSVIPYCSGIATWDEYKKVHLDESIGKYEGNEKDIDFPDTCPACGQPLSKHGEIWKCDNYDCPRKVVRRILYWCSKPCMNIQEMGDALAEELVKTGISKIGITTPFDLYYLEGEFTKMELSELLGKGYGIKTVSTLFSEVKKSKLKPAENVLMGLGIEGIGKENSKVLLSKFNSIENLFAQTEESLTEVPSIGPTLAHNIVEWVKEHGKNALEAMKGIGLQIVHQDNNNALDAAETLSGLNLVFTGKSAFFEGDSIEDEFEKFGAKCGHSVSKKTSFLVIGENPGPSKMQKAVSLNVEVLTEEEFFKKINEKYGIDVTKDRNISGQQGQQPARPTPEKKPEAEPDTNPLF